MQPKEEGGYEVTLKYSQVFRDELEHLRDVSEMNLKKLKDS